MPVYKVEKADKTKDGRIYYFSTYYTDASEKRKKYKSKKFKTKEEAKKAEALFLMSLNEKKVETITINDLFEDYMRIKKDYVKTQTYMNIKKLYRYIGKQLGHFKINKITNKDYEEFKVYINTLGISNAYKAKIHQLAKALYKHGIKYFGLDKNVPEIVGSFTSNDTTLKKCDFFILDEYKQFRTQLEHIVWIAYFDVLYYCGLRKNEANALNWNDIDFNNKTITINKNLVTKIKGLPYIIDTVKTLSSNRTIPIPETVVQSLTELQNYFKDVYGFKKNWFVFGGVRPLSETTICNIKNKACKNANLKQIRVHDFRHSCASLLINNGANITLVAKFLGHSDIEMTLNTYSHMYKSKLDELMITINNL